MPHQSITTKTRGKTIPWARFYDALINVVTLGKAATLRRRIHEQAPYKDGDHILDMGCGTGDQALLAAQALPHATIHGLDAGQAMVKRAQGKTGSKTNLSFELGVMEDTRFEDESFDVIMSHLVMHHLPDDLKPAVLAEMFRLSKAGGKLYIVDLESQPDEKGTPFMIRLHGGRRKMADTIAKLVPLVEAAGFEAIQSGRIDNQFAYLVANKPY